MGSSKYCWSFDLSGMWLLSILQGHVYMLNVSNITHFISLLTVSAVYTYTGLCVCISKHLQ